MKTKNSSVTRLKDDNIYLKVKSVLKKYKKNNSFVVGVSGGPDSLGLAALCNIISHNERYKFFFAIVDHGIRKNSGKEALHCLLYTSPSPRDLSTSRMPSSA